MRQRDYHKLGDLTHFEAKNLLMISPGTDLCQSVPIENLSLRENHLG